MLKAQSDGLWQRWFVIDAIDEVVILGVGHGSNSCNVLSNALVYHGSEGPSTTTPSTTVVIFGLNFVLVEAFLVPPGGSVRRGWER